MNNYEKTLSDARRRFTTYDMRILACRPGVEDLGKHLRTRFLGEEVLLCKENGDVTVGGENADFCQGLSVLDWLCDGRMDAKAAEDYCTVGSLPGIYVGGSGLVMRDDPLARKIDTAPDAFRKTCDSMGAVPVAMGDMGFRVPVFPGLYMCLKFYFADEEFPPHLTFLWDKNMLQFVRYETVYYIAGCIRERLLKGINAGHSCSLRLP